MIIEIILLVSVVGAFYRLAFDYEKQYPWLYSVYGALTLFGGIYLSAFLIALVCAMNGKIMDVLILSVLGYVIGGTCCSIFYFLLRKNFKKKEELSKLGGSKVLDDKL